MGTSSENAKDDSLRPPALLVLERREAFRKSSQSHWAEVRPHYFRGKIGSRKAAFIALPPTSNDATAHSFVAASRYTYHWPVLRTPDMVYARCIALAILGYSVICGRAFVYRPPLAVRVGHVITRPSGFMKGTSRRRASRTVGTFLALEDITGVDDVPSPPASWSVLGDSTENMWTIGRTGLAATAIAAAAAAAALFHPEVANAAADTFGECSVVFSSHPRCCFELSWDLSRVVCAV